MPRYGHRDRIRTKHSWEYGLLSLTAALNGAQLIGTNRGQNLGGRSLFVLTAAIVVPADIVPVAEGRRTASWRLQYTRRYGRTL
jgi:hypothetical protein